MLSLVMCLLYMMAYWGLNDQDTLNSPNSVADMVYELLKTDEQQRQQRQQQNAKIAAIEEQLIIKNEEQRHQLEQQLKPYTYFEQDKCVFPGLSLPKEFVIYAAGGYSGRAINHQIDQSGHYTSQFDIHLYDTTRPVVLILAAYEPTIWNITWSQGAKIAAIFVSGYHKQIVEGVNKNVPVLISTYDNKGSCGYFYIKNAEQQELNQLSNHLFGQAVDYLSNKHVWGKILLGKSQQQRTITTNDVPLRAGKLGLEDALAKGLIRWANEQDILAWEEYTGTNGPKLNYPNQVYVVLKPFTIPAGLYGANRAIFIIPKGVPYPQGNAGHSDIYDFDSGVCLDPICHTR